MELRALKYLLSISERGSFTAAAHDHFVTQPAVSIALRKLEQELGQRLYLIEGRTVSFTTAGRITLDYAARISELESELLQQMHDLSGLKKGRIALGTIDAASIYVLPEVFSRFRERYPGIEITLEISSTMPLVGKLGNGLLDLVIGTIPFAAEEGFEVFPIYSEPLLVIAPFEHPLAGRAVIDPAVLSSYPFISFHEGSITRRIVEDAFADKGVRPVIAMAIDSPEAIKNLVAAGLGLAVLPRRAVQSELDSKSIVDLKIRGLRLERKLGLILRPGRYLSATARAFLGVLEEVMRVGLPRRLLIREVSRGRRGGGSGSERPL
jgi:DNA-binding transcriptional LysR family regulator